MAWLAATGAVVVVLAAAGAARSDDRDTHGRDAVPDYGRVFNQNQVGRLDVRIGTSDWQAVLADMQNMAGPSGFGLNVPFSNEQFAACAGRLEANACVAGDPPVTGRCAQTFPPGRLACLPLGGAGAGRDEVELLPRTPIYVPADISFDGETFRRVGYRLKGNSTLLLTWRRGSDKLPFRLNFDGLEARLPGDEGPDVLRLSEPQLHQQRPGQHVPARQGRDRPVPRRRCAVGGHGVHARLSSIAAPGRRTWGSSR